VEAVCEQSKKHAYVDRHGGAEALIDQIFPSVLDMLDFLTPRVRADMAAAGLRTVASIASASDASLLALAGMGPARLRKLRAWCREFRGDQKASRLSADHAARLRGQEW
jgi:hypothetical protein